MENYDDQLSRLNLMADDDGTSWDLSENDQAAISAVLDKLSSVEAERDALAQQNLELRGALERAIARLDYCAGLGSQRDFDATRQMMLSLQTTLSLPLPAAAEKVKEWREKAELLEWLESIGGELYRTDSDDPSRKRWAVPGHHGAEGYESPSSALRAARGAK